MQHQIPSVRKEWLKELACINRTVAILKKGKSIASTLQEICLILPEVWQYPNYTCARITYNFQVYQTPNFEETAWRIAQTFDTIKKQTGLIEVFYLKEFEAADEGVFLLEERYMIDNISSLITSHLNNISAVKMFHKKSDNQPTKIKKEGKDSINTHELLDKMLNQAGRDIFHDLMSFKVKEILIIATLYDAYIIERDGRFSDQLLGNYQQLNLTSVPRVTGVTSVEAGLKRLKSKHFDLIILMMGENQKKIFGISEVLKQKFPYIPVYLLLNNKRNVSSFDSMNRKLKNINKIFVWTGNSKVFLAMVKQLEDKVNIANDAQVGLVKAILLVEDSSNYYSRYLPMLYELVYEQTQRIIADVTTDELYKLLKIRARPKILLASNYEEAVGLFDRYKENLLCLISDVTFRKDGKLNKQAGLKLVKHVREKIPNLPTIIQSSDSQNSSLFSGVNAMFISKNSENLLQDIKGFIKTYLGFGNFVFKNKNGKKIAVAHSLQEFEEQLAQIPYESLIYHGKKNHFSLWLLARGEIKIAKMINPLRVSDFGTPDQFRVYLLSTLKRYRNEENRGKVVNFSPSSILNESNIVSMGSGSLGGKGRGLAFINSLIYNVDFSQALNGIQVKTPHTALIGTDEFDFFMDNNDLREFVLDKRDFQKVKRVFLNSKFSPVLVKKLKTFLKLVQSPIAVRSSSLLEDSMNQPFSGIFATYILPNNHPSFNQRLKQLLNAIKLVYASIYSPNARRYFEAINYEIADEKMGIAIQKVVGNEYVNENKKYYYPHISGTAQSHNYYPVAHMKPADGFAVAAVGLGQYVVEGEKAYRFSPKHPKIEILSLKDLLKSSQVDFFAIDMNKSKLNLLEGGEDVALARLSIGEAEKHGTLKHLASVYDPTNDRLEPGLTAYGPRIINFANILRFNYIQLSKTITIILNLLREAMGAPVEIEFAVDLTKAEDRLPVFYLLQIKPLLGAEADFNIDVAEIDKEKLVLYAEKSLGNGKIENITDIIYVMNDRFDKLQTLEMAKEIEKLNAKMQAENRKYILIGPGRWGTRDRFIGIPVSWSQISNAQIIVEVGIDDFPLDASLGSHFFHNVIAMNVGYFSVKNKSKNSFITWQTIDKQQVIDETKYFRHVRFAKPLQVIMDGKKRISMVLEN